jgi:hypothetical protein
MAMKALTKIAAGGVAAAALFSAAPAAAQYYPGYGGYGGNVVGQVINQVLGGGYGGYGGYGVNQQAVVGQCVAAVQQRLNASYGYGAGYGGYSPYGGGYNGYAGGGARVLGISRVEPRSGGGLTVRGVANSGRSGGYAYGGGYANNTIDLTFKCRTDYRGFIVDIDVDRAEINYGTNYNNGYNQGYSQGYTPYDPYAAYGYRRY